jgi:hypothetical protein
VEGPDRAQGSSKNKRFGANKCEDNGSSSQLQEGRARKNRDERAEMSQHEEGDISRVFDSQKRQETTKGEISSKGKETERRNPVAA